MTNTRAVDTVSTPDVETVTGRASHSRWGRIPGSEHLGLLGVFVLLFIYLAIRAPYFLTSNNISNLLLTVSMTGIIGFGMTFVLLTGEIDISVGSGIAFGSSLLGMLSASNGMPLPLAMLVVVVSTMVVGLAAGAVISLLGVPSFIVTLALYLAYSGAALRLSNATPVSLTNEWFLNISSGRLGPIPYPAVFMLMVFAVSAFLARRTTFGRSVYAVGSNATSAYLSGVPVVRIKIIVFGMTGLLAGISSILLSSSLGSGSPLIGVGVEFEVIAAVIIGGASLSGGRGTMLGTLLGLLFVGTLQNGMILLGVNSYTQKIAQGAIVLIAVISSVMRPKASAALAARRARLSLARMS